MLSFYDCLETVLQSVQNSAFVGPGVQVFKCVHLRCRRSIEGWRQEREEKEEREEREERLQTCLSAHRPSGPEAVCSSKGSAATPSQEGTDR